jgi:hypothetical protein
MININLIPAALRKNGQGNASSLTINIPKEILFGVGAGLVILMLAVHLLLGALWLIGISHLSACQKQWDQLAPDKSMLDAISNESRDLKNKINMISDMTTKKSMEWALKFNAISDVLPRGLWLRRMILDKTDLTMEGSVVSKSQNEINNVGKFLAALKQNDPFMKDFSSLEVNSIQRGKSRAVEVTDFTVMAKLNETKPKQNP